MFDVYYDDLSADYIRVIIMEECVFTCLFLVLFDDSIHHRLIRCGSVRDDTVKVMLRMTVLMIVMIMM